jgi:simple sugar transport system substrate-binding protein
MGALERIVGRGDVDVSPTLVKAIESDEAIAGIDQLMFLQGYLPTVPTRYYLYHCMMPDADILTGPAIIDESNIEKVKHRLMEAGLN